MPAAAMSALHWTIAGAPALAGCAQEWNALVAAARYPPLLRSEVLLAALDAFGDRSELLALGRSEGRLVFAGLLRRAGPGRWRVFQPSQLPLGACVLARGCEWQAVLASLTRALPGIALSVRVSQQDPRLAPRPADSPRLGTRDYLATGWIDVDRSFEEFWRARGKNLRQNLRKQQRRLEGQGAGVSFEFLQEEAGLLEALRDLAQLEGSGWKGAMGTALSLDNAQGRFYRQVLLAFARDRAAYACRLRLDGRPIAAYFAIRDADAAVVLKTSYDESLRGFSPAQLLHARAFERHFAERDASRIEFYGPLMEWHARWTDTSCMLYHVDYFRTPALRALREAASTLAGVARRAARLRLTARPPSQAAPARSPGTAA